MSESEVSKHVMRSYKIWKRPGINWKEKLIEICIEILIIVFAVSLSLYFERLRENQHDKKIEKNFLIGLKQDLKNDIQELSTDSGWFAREAIAFKYFYNAANYSNDSVKTYRTLLYDYTQLMPNTNRYEALKSSGKLDVIENIALSDSIVDLYQDKIPGLIEVFIKPFNEFKSRELFPFLNDHIITDSSGNENLEEVLRMPTAKNYLKKWDMPINIASRYHTVIEASKNIIAQIDEELK